MDFFQVKERSLKKGEIEVYPDFIVTRSKDLMVRGKAFYAVWDQDREMWSTDDYDVQRLVDKELYDHRKNRLATDDKVIVKSMKSFSSGSWVSFRKFLSNMSDSNKTLDEKLTFANTKTKKTDYISRRLPYSLEAGSIAAYEELISTLYDPDERQKIEWAIGAVVSGDSKDIQKFLVLYGEAGAGKSTILNLIQQLFEGYYTTFEAKELASANNTFSTEVFKSNPLVAIQHDGDLSRIEDNSKLNSIISHEEMTMNEKYKPKYTDRVNAFLFMATNKPVKITDAKSGIIRRLIDVRPSGRKVPTKRYHELVSQVSFELGAIASHCLEVYQELGKNYYSGYRPLSMMFQTDAFFNFVEWNYDEFSNEEGIGLGRAYDMFKQYCDDSGMEVKLPRYKFREELKNYFANFEEVTRVNGKQVRSYYSGFLKNLFKVEVVPKEKEKPASWLKLDKKTSLLDTLYKDCPAQYASEYGTPVNSWSKNKSKLSDIDTSKVHYVQAPKNPAHVFVDFDLKDSTGKKSLSLNIEAASKWPPTYAELSKGGSGLHLHYVYDGDVTRLAPLFSEGIEVKCPIGDSAIRRRVSLCNDLPVANIGSGLPLKGEKMVNIDSVKSEKSLRSLIKRNLQKDIHPSTKSSMDFILKILDDAYESGLHYDVSDLRPSIFAFAMNSSNQADYCIKLISKMPFKSEEPSEPLDDHSSDDLVFFDVEVFPNLFVVVWKIAGEGRKCVRMINPTPQQIEDLMRFKLVGFNCRRYDNHILYSRYLGRSNEALYAISQRIISDSPNALVGEAYNVSYTDVYDFASAANKMSLKKFEILLRIHHQELGLPWDKPVPEELWEKVAEYCENDVVATEATFNYLKGDWTARKILAELSGLTVNDTTNEHTKRIVFGTNKHPQNELVYTDLSEMFPGYTFTRGKSLYRGEDPKEGGHVYAEPGVYFWVPVDDVESMHPTSIEQLNLLGPYTKRYSDMKKARLAIKHNDREALASLLDGKLIPFVERADAGEFSLKDLSTALKTALNSAYGLTSAKFDNPFRDPRNVDNIVAKRGALFMIDLKHAVWDRGFKVAHIKTDSIKIPNATPEILKFVSEFGTKYGYKFEHEATYRKMCLVNDAVYIAQYATPEECMDLYGYVPKDCKDHPGEWTATGAQFAQPYVFKTLFSHEPIEFEDLCETKTVSTALYLDMNEGYPDVTEPEKVYALRNRTAIENEESKLTRREEALLAAYSNVSDEALKAKIAVGHNYQFVGKTGLFCPIVPGSGGGTLLREKDGRFYAVGGTKGYRWLEAETVELLEKKSQIDIRYYESLANEAKKAIDKYMPFDEFVSDAELELKHSVDDSKIPPWVLPCGEEQYEDCRQCPRFRDGKCRTDYALQEYM